MDLATNIIRIMVIEDNRVLREGLIAKIDGQIDMKLVAATGSSKNLSKIACKNSPDMILLDLGLDRHDNISFIRYVNNVMPETLIIGMSFGSVHSDIDVFKAAGMSGFILKDATDEEFLKVIRSVGQREKYSEIIEK
jgi:DNA-binding NarL/FixJ family response regulator